MKSLALTPVPSPKGRGDEESINHNRHRPPRFEATVRILSENVFATSKPMRSYTRAGVEVRVFNVNGTFSTRCSFTSFSRRNRP